MSGRLVLVRYDPVVNARVPSHINSGTDNTGGLCTIAAVPNLFSGDFDAHMGPYDGFTLGCDQDYLRKSGIATSSSDIPVDVSLTSLLLSEPQSI